MDLLDRVPPQNLEAEQSALGSLLIDKRAYYALQDAQVGLQGSDFYREAHQVIYEAVAGMYDREQQVDIITIQEELRASGKLEQVGGIEYLCTLIDLVPSASNAAYYGRIVRDKAVARQYIDLGMRIVAAGHNQEAGASAISELISRSESEISRRMTAGAWTRYSDIIASVVQRMETPDALMGIQTGIAGLDKITMGLHRKTLIVIAARPGLGKTALGLQIAENAARSGVPVAIFSLEMDKDELGLRSVQAATGMSGYQIRHRIPDDMWTSIYEQTGPVSDLPIYVDDEPTCRYSEIFPKARAAVQEHGVGLVIFDYAQLGDGPKGESRNREIGEVVRAMRNAAKRLDVPWIVLSQLSRRCEEEGNRRPRKSDLRDSGEIENEMNVCMFLHRPDKENPNHVQIIVDKNRQLATGVVEAIWLPEIMRFADREDHRAGSDGPPPYWT